MHLLMITKQVETLLMGVIIMATLVFCAVQVFGFQKLCAIPPYFNFNAYFFSFSDGDSKNEC